MGICLFSVFYKFPNKVRYTVTFKNLFDVFVSFVKLIFELKIKNKTTVRARRKNNSATHSTDVASANGGGGGTCIKSMEEIQVAVFSNFAKIFYFYEV